MDLLNGYEEIASFHRITVRQAIHRVAIGVILNMLPQVIEAAIPDELPVLHDDPYPLWQVLGYAPKGRTVPMISVRGLPRRHRPVYHDGWFVRARGGLIKLGGAVNLASRDDDAAPVWEYLTLADIEAERHRRQCGRVIT